MKKTDIFDRLDNVIGNYMEGNAKDIDVIKIALEVNKYLVENPHTNDLSLSKNSMKTIQLTTEQAKELYKSNPEFRTTILHEFTDGELGIEGKLKIWEELRYVSGFSVNHAGNIIQTKYIRELDNKFIYATETQAKSALAKAQLSQLMKDLGDECIVDWTNQNQTKYVIERYKNMLSDDVTYGRYFFLSFKTKKVRDKFLEKHKDLINDYFEL